MSEASIEVTARVYREAWATVDRLWREADLVEGLSEGAIRQRHGKRMAAIKVASGLCDQMYSARVAELSSLHKVPL